MKRDILEPLALCASNGVITKGDLGLNGSQISGLILGGGVFAVHHTVSTLDIQQMKLHGVVSINVGIVEEKLLLQHKNIIICQSDLSKNGSSLQPIRCSLCYSQEEGREKPPHPSFFYIIVSLYCYF